MRDIVWILGGIVMMMLVAVVWGLLVLDVRLYPWSLWRIIYDCVRSERYKKYKSREDVI